MYTVNSWNGDGVGNCFGETSHSKYRSRSAFQTGGEVGPDEAGDHAPSLSTQCPLAR